MINSPKNHEEKLSFHGYALQPNLQHERGRFISVFLFVFIVLFLLSSTTLFAQTYHTNGDAVDHGNGLVRITASSPAAGTGVWQTSSAWCTTKIDLTQPFDMSFDLFFGCESGNDGGDGMTFTLQNQGLNALGGGGGFLGIGGPNITPSISIEFDTWYYNAMGSNDIADDHIAIDINGDVTQANGSIFFTGSSGTQVTNQAIAGGRDLENCGINTNDFYTIRIVWDPVNKVLQLYEEGNLSLTYTNDIVNTIFGGSNEVYWGFTGATGSASNEQWVAPHGTIIPWECTTNSCCAAFTPTPTGPTSICTGDITLGLGEAYANYSWSTGATSSTIDVSVPGTYTVNVQQVQNGGTLCPGTYTYTIGTSGATADISGDASLCNSTATSPVSVALTGTAPWTVTYAIDGVAQTPITGITTSPYVFQGTGTHVYTLVSASDNSGCNSVVSGSATIEVLPVPVGHDDTFDAPGSAELSVDDEGGVYEWYDAPTGGNLVFTGDVFNTPILNTTTTYYVNNASIISVVRKSVAMMDNTSGNGANVNDIGMPLPKEVCFIDFLANENFTFDTITCRVNGTGAGTGSVTVYITSYPGPGAFAGAENIVKDSINIAVTGTGLRDIIIPLHFNCTAGTYYHISYGATGNLQSMKYWQMINPASFPISTDPELTIYQNAPQTGSYPGLFNWRISTLAAGSACGRTPVTAYTCPTAILSGDAVICNDGSTTPLTVVLTGRAPWTLTYAIDGVTQPSITGITSSPYTITSLTGAHTYTLVSVSNADATCTANTVSGTADVTLTAQAPVGHDAPIDASGNAALSVDITGDTFEWYDAPTGGNLLNTGDTYNPSGLTATTTYYVNNASIVNVVRKSVAMLNNTNGNGANVNDIGYPLPKEVCFLDFLANENFTFDTITCRVNGTGAGTGSVTVYITSYPGPGTFAGAENVVKDSINIAVTGTGFRDIIIPLNFNCTAGTYYHISYGTTGNLQSMKYWQMMNPASYPISTDPELTIYQNAPQTGSYPGLFNWRISMTSATPTCGRTPVTAYLCPTATLTGTATICDDGTTTTPLSVALTSTPPWSFTYAIDGVDQAPITGITTSPYVFQSQTGAHVYTLTAVSNNRSNGCTGNFSGTATVSVNPESPVGIDDVFLAPGTADLSVDATTGTFNWYDAPTGGNLVGTGITYTTSTLTTTTTYYVEEVVNGHSSCSRTPVTAYVCPTATLSGDATICDDGVTTTPLSIVLTGISPWSVTYAIDGVAQTPITGITSSPYTLQSATGAHLYTLTLVSTINSAGCTGNVNGSAVVSVNPDAPMGQDNTFVPPGSTQLSVHDMGGTYNWYDALTGGNLVHTGATFNTPILNGTTTYYVERVEGGFASCERTAVTAVATPVTVPLFFPNLVTPNGDGNNDLFVIQGLPDESAVSIYNNWGSRIYDNNDYGNDWNPDQQTDGMYYYDVKMPDGKEYHGWLQIVH